MEGKNNGVSVILGLDISTACIGISIIYDNGKDKPIIEEITHISPKIDNNIKGIEALILRKEIFERDFLTKYTDAGITDCVIESPMIHSMSGVSNAHTIAQLLQFNALLSEAVYRVLHIIPVHISSSDARMMSFPQLLSLRKFDKKGELYPKKHIAAALKEKKLILFGSYPFDCDKKSVMMDLVCDMYPDIEWELNKKGDVKKENFDACDSLVCALAYVNKLRYGDITTDIIDTEMKDTGENECTLSYKVKVWDMVFEKNMVFPTK